MSEAYANPREARLDRDRQIAIDYSAGTPIEEIAAKAGLRPAVARAIATRLGARLPRHLDGRYAAHPTANAERNEKMCAEYLSGDSLEVVGQRYGITRERVRQILVKSGHEERHHGFNAPRRVEARERAIPKMVARDERRARIAAERARVREMYDTGATYGEIAEAMSHSITWVQQTVWITGGPSRSRNAGKPMRRLTEEERADICYRYASNEPNVSIAAIHDISPAVVQAIASNHGVKRPLTILREQERAHQKTAQEITPATISRAE